MRYTTTDERLAAFMLEQYGPACNNDDSGAFGLELMDGSAVKAMASEIGADLSIDAVPHRPRLWSLIHERHRSAPAFSIDWRAWPGVMLEKPVRIPEWGSGATQGDIVGGNWYTYSDVTLSPGADAVANDGAEPFARDDDITYWSPEGAAGPSGRDVTVILYAEDGSVYGARTVSKAYDLESSKAAGKRRRARVWSEIENLLLGLLLMGGMDGTAAGGEAQRLKEEIGLEAIDAFLSTTAQAQPLRDGLAAAQAGGMFPWLDTTVSPAGDVVATVSAMTVRWTS